MFQLFGKITKRILSGEIDRGAVFPPKRGGPPPPSANSVRYGKGYGLGKGATRKRSGKGAKTSED